jgi:hypothetical protein
MVREAGVDRDEPARGAHRGRAAQSGKNQLRIDEARKIVDLCIHKANEGDAAAIGVMTVFLVDCVTIVIVYR